MSRAKSIDTFVEVDLGEWDDEELIDEISERGYYVLNSRSNNEIVDDIFELYKEWLHDKGDDDRRFEKAMRKFFEKHLNKVSV